MATWALERRKGAGWTCCALLIVITRCCTVQAQLQITNIQTVVTLPERQNSQITLTPASCSDAGTNGVLRLGTVSPNSPCGSCFSVLPCTPEGWCLKYIPNVGTLSYQIAPIYDIEVICSLNGVNVSQTVNVRLTVNSPPRFDPDVLSQSHTLTNTKNVAAGTVFFDVNAVDDDGDAIEYTMTTAPSSNNFQIGRGNGNISAVNDLRVECTTSIDFLVYITDNINNKVGPQTIHTTLHGSNVAPDITNLDTSIQVLENTAVGYPIRTMTVTDDGAPSSLSSLTYTLTADPPSTLSYFEIDVKSKDIRVKSNLDYENTQIRKANLTIVASDGYCTSPVHYLYVTVTDVNEPPVISPRGAIFTTYEGQITINPSWTTTDPDASDTKTYSIIEGNSLNRFLIDPNSGKITSNGEYNVDNGAMPTSVNLTVRVTDRGGLSDNTTITINIQDSNDNRPVIPNGPFVYTVEPCRTSGGVTLGTMTCTDEDSSFQGNNVTNFSGGGNGITVVSNGNIILNTVPAVGQSITTTAYCSDRGLYPNSLQSIQTTITVTGVTCTTTQAPTAAPVTAAPATQKPTTTITITTTAAPTTATTKKNWWDENLPWIIIGSLLATALLALLIYMLATYCWRYCLRCCRNDCCTRPPRPTKLQSPPRTITPVEMPTPRPTPPPVVVGNPNAHLHDFWKERYPDDDYGKQPNRKAIPRPVTPPFSDGNNVNTAVKKPKSCNIL